MNKHEGFLRLLRYQRNLSVMTRSSVHMQEQYLDASKRMLHLLQDMAPESKETYHPIIWQLVCCPFTPLLILFCDILSNGKRNLEKNKEALAATERLELPERYKLAELACGKLGGHREGFRAAREIRDMSSRFCMARCRRCSSSRAQHSHWELCHMAGHLTRICSIRIHFTAILPQLCRLQCS
ncbi:hypothetical protein V1517DRAFT_320020 [Lipomyces orientalis]|uniref:Uncharacterized protein n=1 Tax=Lipomyces orientalis TaxID=1233043 RepID=A0ACC3TS33_9ASCO